MSSNLSYISKITIQQASVINIFVLDERALLYYISVVISSYVADNGKLQRNGNDRLQTMFRAGICMEAED